MEDAANAPEAPIEVPAEALSPEALRGVMEDFILREGTDYGRQETEHATKVERVRAQLQAGEVKIIYDPSSESVTLVTRAEWRRRLAASGPDPYT